MTLTHGTPGVWLSHAREAREVADAIGDMSARKVTLRIADAYEKKAVSARARLMGLAQGDTD
jgi:hypothetical protein